MPFGYTVPDSTAVVAVTCSAGPVLPDATVRRPVANVRSDPATVPPALVAIRR